jgi:hypothetical protein
VRALCLYLGCSGVADGLHILESLPGELADYRIGIPQ